MSVRDLILAKVGERGLSLAALSKEMGKNHAYLQQFIERGSPKKLPEDVRAYLAVKLGLAESALKDSHSINQQMMRAVPTPHLGIDSSKIPAINAGPEEDQLRVLGMAEGGPDGWNLFNGEVVQWIDRPDNLKGVPAAYAVYIRGDSMSPRYDAGEIVHIHPGRPVQPGSYVLVQRHNPEDEAHPFAIVKRLVRRTSDKVVLAQLNPEKQLTVPAKDIVSIHRVVGSSEP